MRGTTVFVQADGAKGVRLQIQYPSRLEQAPIQAFLRDDSSVRCDGVQFQSGVPAPIKAFPANSALAARLAAVEVHGAPAKLSDAVVPALDEGSSISFLTNQGTNGIHAFDDNTLELANFSRKMQIGREVVEIADVDRDTRARVSADDKGLTVQLKGASRRLLVAGMDQRPSWVEYLQARRDLTAWLTTAILIGGTALTVLTRLKLIRLEDKK
jgi:hypothetical protein